MNLRTPRFLERRYGFRASFHLFRWGFHYKLRRGQRWRHFSVKLTRRPVFGMTRGRFQVWVGCWGTRHGARGRVRGFRLAFAYDRIPSRPTRNTRIPFLPQRMRQTDRQFEVR